MKSICISTYVYGSYTKFIPYYIYSILKSYPDYYVKILVREQLNHMERKCLNILKNNLSNNFEVKENYFNTIDLPEMKTKGQATKTLRWLIPKKEFNNFKYGYIGDVDFLIIKEKPSLIEGHLDHCKKINLPYSNRIRPGTKRLSGLHFFIVKDYYSKIGPLIDYYLSNTDELYKAINKSSREEEFFYGLVGNTIGFGDINKKNYRPHHGFHLGCATHENKIRDGYYFSEKYENEKSNNKTYLTMKKQFQVYFNDPIFIKLLKTLPIKEILVLSRYIPNTNLEQIKGINNFV